MIRMFNEVNVSEETPVLLQRVENVAVVTLNRPQRHNSLVPPFLQALQAALETAVDDPQVRAVLLQANGRSFSTGGDMGGFYEHLDTIGHYADELVGLLNQTILTMLALPVPIVVAVDGIVNGGSLGLVLAADVVLLTHHARFTPYYNVVGFSPDGGWTALLPKLIGARRAAAVLLRNMTISAEEAVEWGLASKIVPAGRVQAASLEVAADIACKKPGAIRHTRQLLAHDLAVTRADLAREQAHFVAQIKTDEAQQGIRTFMAHRRERLL